MHHHHLASLVALWISLFTAMAGATFAILVGIRESRRPTAKAFDFAASARRIRTAPIPPRDRA